MIEPNRQGEVWVFAEQEDERLNDVALELCGKARQLADRLGVAMGAVLAGWNVRELSYRLIALGADKVYHVHDTVLEHYRTQPYARVQTSSTSQKYRHWTKWSTIFTDERIFFPHQTVHTCSSKNCVLI